MTDKTTHKPGCEALGGYGHGIGSCSCSEVQPEALPDLDIDTAGHYGIRIRGYSVERVKSLHAEIQQLKAQLSARQAAPDGWRLVPVASTAAMEWAFRSAEVRYSNGAGRMLPMDPHSAFKAQYRDMLSAAPPPPEREPLTQEQKDAVIQEWIMSRVQGATND